jgi:hypothetical protein
MCEISATRTKQIKKLFKQREGVNFMNFFNKYKNIITLLLLLIILIAVIVTKSDISLSTDDIKIELTNGNKVQFNQAFTELLCSVEDSNNRMDQINIKLDGLLDDKYEQIIFEINKQYAKIQEEPEDIKQLDLEYVISKWSILPEKMKNDVLKTKYDIIKKFYQNTYIVAKGNS